MKKEMKRTKTVRKSTSPKTLSLNFIFYIFIFCLAIVIIFSLIPKEKTFLKGYANGLSEGGDSNGGIGISSPSSSPSNGLSTSNGNGGTELTSENGNGGTELVQVVEPVTTICGNGVCESKESYSNCILDCCAKENEQVLSASHCCRGLKGVNDCYPGMPCIYPIICVDCGDDTCKRPENPFNCPIDCGPVCGNGICESTEDYKEDYVTCPQDCVPQCGNEVCEKPVENQINCNEDCCGEAGYQVGYPFVCCEGLTLVDFQTQNYPVTYAIQNPSGRYCVNCGDALCEQYETIENCPRDCNPAYINCENLPPIETNIEYQEGQSGIFVNLDWSYPSVIGLSVKSQRILTADDCATAALANTTTCGWYNYPQTINTRNWNEPSGDELLKFYRLKSVVKIGCKPVCAVVDEMEGIDIEGWYDSCTMELIKQEDCDGYGAVCKYEGEQLEGWYSELLESQDPVYKGSGSSNHREENLLSFATPPSGLIIYEDCSETYKECDMQSKIFVKFVQELKVITPCPPGQVGFAVAGGVACLGPATNINYVTNLLGDVESNEILGELNADYLAKWNCAYQTNEGTALAVCYTQPCVDSYTGVFDAIHGYPYFVSATIDQELIWVADLPERITFSFCPGRNYLNLPLDTEIETALELCNDYILSPAGIDEIGVWDAEEQAFINPNSGAYGAVPCDFIRLPGENFDLNPGQTYMIHIPEGRGAVTWTQR